MLVDTLGSFRVYAADVIIHAAMAYLMTQHLAHSMPT
jgi:hypothetical protein